jgi:RNA polymerase, sigma 70 subunit, RpoD
MQVLRAVSTCPTTISLLLDAADRVERGEIRLDEVVDAFIDPNALDAEAVGADEDAVLVGGDEIEVEDDDEESEGGDVEVDKGPQLEEALERFAVIRAAYTMRCSSAMPMGKCMGKVTSSSVVSLRSASWKSSSTFVRSMS